MPKKIKIVSVDRRNQLVHAIGPQFAVKRVFAVMADIASRVLASAVNERPDDEICWRYWGESDWRPLDPIVVGQHESLPEYASRSFRSMLDEVLKTKSHYDTGSFVCDIRVGRLRIKLYPLGSGSLYLGSEVAHATTLSGQDGSEIDLVPHICFMPAQDRFDGSATSFNRNFVLNRDDRRIITSVLGNADFENVSWQKGNDGLIDAMLAKADFSYKKFGTGPGPLRIDLVDVRDPPKEIVGIA